MKKALLAVSFGTSYPDTLEKSIAPVEAALAQALPERQVFRAFTSGVIRHRLEQRDGVYIDSLSGALERLDAAGYDDVLVQPVCILNGGEYDEIAAGTMPWAGRFCRFALGRPLLASEEDCRAAAGAVVRELEAPAEDEALVFMGHGSERFASPAYAFTERALHDLGWERAFLGAMEGRPTLDEVMDRLRAHPRIRRVRLQPFMVTAGRHAEKEMAGEGDSWRTRLTGAGYQVECVFRGLGEYPAFRALFAGHARAAERS